MFYIAMATHFLRVLKQKWAIEIIDYVTVTSFCNQSQQNFAFFVCDAKKDLCTKFEQNRTKNIEVERNGK